MQEFIRVWIDGSVQPKLLSVDSDHCLVEVVIQHLGALIGDLGLKSLVRSWDAFAPAYLPEILARSKLAAAGRRILARFLSEWPSAHGGLRPPFAWSEGHSVSRYSLIPRPPWSRPCDARSDRVAWRLRRRYLGRHSPGTEGLPERRAARRAVA